MNAQRGAGGQKPQRRGFMAATGWTRAGVRPSPITRRDPAGMFRFGNSAAPEPAGEGALPAELTELSLEARGVCGLRGDLVRTFGHFLADLIGLCWNNLK